VPAKAYAQSDLKGVMGQINTQLSGAGAFISTLAAVVGFGLVAFGLFKLVMRKPGGQDSIGGAVGMMVGGALLLVVGTVASIGSETVVGPTSESGLDNLSFDEPGSSNTGSSSN